MTEQVFEHRWLGRLRRYGKDQVIGHIDIDPNVRPARLKGGSDAEVLVTVGPVCDGSEFDAILESAVRRIRAALADLENIKVSAVALAPANWRRHYENADARPLIERLFLEGFDVISPSEMEIAFDFEDLDLLVVRVDADGQAGEAHLHP